VPIYRRQPQFSTQALPAQEHRAQITAHIERHLGPVTSVLRPSAVDGVRIDIHHVAATTTRPVQTLVTSGMSDLPMRVPEGTDSPRHLELMVTLPESWKLDDQAIENLNWYWPVRQLAALAYRPHQLSSWLGWGHTVPNGDPPEALAPGTKLSGAIIVPSLLVPTDFYELETGSRTIAFYGVVPLYPEEMDMRLRDGMEALLAKMVDHGITDLIDPARKNVAAKKRFGWF
jgi:hypothetical protein